MLSMRRRIGACFLDGGETYGRLLWGGRETTPQQRDHPGTALRLFRPTD